LQDFFFDGSSYPKDIRFEHQLRVNGIEEDLGRYGNPLDLKILVHDQEGDDVSWYWLEGYEASPDEDSTQFASAPRRVRPAPENGGTTTIVEECPLRNAPGILASLPSGLRPAVPLQT
jgi:hypothetical protein